MTDQIFPYADDSTGVLDPGADVSDYVALLKPRVMSLVVFTGLVGLYAAPVSLHPVLAFIAVLCIAVAAGASGALNMWYDADIDARMARTVNRPIPAGRVAPGEALAFGTVLSVGSVALMGIALNWVAAFLLGLTIVFYVVVYTMWLKRRTPQNIVIGGAAGAFPPLIGWAAATGSVSAEAMVLFGLIFFWTPPHFWALSLFTTKDYEGVAVPMLPVVAGEAETRRQILIYSILLAPLGVVPWIMGWAGPFYGVVAAGLGIMFLQGAVKLWRSKNVADAKALFGTSILYLFGVFAALGAEALGLRTLIEGLVL